MYENFKADFVANLNNIELNISKERLDRVIMSLEEIGRASCRERV